MQTLLFTMILLPLAGSILNGLILRTPYPRRAGVVATAAAGGSFIAAISLWLELLSSHTPIRTSVEWFHAGSLHVNWGFTFDWLTAVMALIVTGIGTVIHLYSIGYMSDERTPYRYFAYLNLFLFAMLTLISADNLPVLFVGWEGVGLCSYLLIGYWYGDIDKANAGIKAFVVNRIGDAGFLIGMFLCFGLFNSLEFQTINEMMPKMTGANLQMLNLAALCLFIGAMGKSAQIPLYVWLPDAMAGPTPVSALIHAATMVTAGIYLIVRMNPLFQVTADTNLFITSIGAATALLSALIATSQRDIKKVLAYSTVSQLGLIFMALGAGAYFAAIFHVMTHAFFKALLFLGAGSVIHGLHGEQDIAHMGGLRKSMPVTFWTFLIGTIAICGIPPFAGFFSKDTILYDVLRGPHGTLFWALGSFASFLTAFYMTRLFVLVFLGEYRGHAHAHESGPVMTVPLVLLAVGSALTGFLGLPHGLHFGPNILGEFLQPMLPHVAETESALSEMAAMGLAVTLAVIAISGALWIFRTYRKDVNPVLKPFKTLFENKFYVDELYGILFLKPFDKISGFLARVFDGSVIDAILISPSKVARAGASILSIVQFGSAQFYLLVMLVGALGVLWFCLKGVMV